MSTEESAGPVEATILCEACHLGKPVDQFLEMTSELDPQAPSPQVCDHCRKFGPPVSDPMAALTPQYRVALQMLASGAGVRPAARKAGLDQTSIRRALEGKENKLFRAALQRLMLDAGLGPDVLIKIMKDATTATKLHFHPGDKDFVEHPDYANRLKTAQMLMKAWGADEPKELPDQNAEKTVTVVVNTNLGSNRPIEVPGTITARAPIDIEARK